MTRPVRTPRPTGFFFFCLLLALTGRGQVTLTGTSYTQSFDDIGSGLPNGWTVRTGATATVLGTATDFTTTATSWGDTGGRFKNFASADGLEANASVTNQTNATDRVLGIRQTGAVGDPGAAFTLQLANTLGVQNLQVSFKLQSLAGTATVARTATWLVQYGLGETPGSFVTVPTNPETLTTTFGTFANTTVTATLPLAVNDQNQPLWIRIVTLEGTSGTGNRPSTGIDDFSLTYEAASTDPLISAPATASVPQTVAGTPSNVVSVQVAAANLSAPIAVAFNPATTSFEVATAAGGPFGPTASLPATGGTLFVRSAAGAALGSNATTLTLTSETISAQTAVSGTVTAPITECGTSRTPIATVRSGIPAQNAFTGTPVSIAGRITGIFGANRFYVQDATGGIALFTTGVVTSNGLALGDSVQLTGTTARFNGEAQLSTITCVARLGAGTPPAPVVYEPTAAGASLNTFLNQNEGRLVQIPQVNVVGTGTFSGGTNYPYNTCPRESSEVRIDAGATALIGTPVPTVTQDVVGLVGRFINATGATDILQLFPRTPTDLTPSGVTCPNPGGTIPVVCVPGGDESQFAQTLKSTTWNIEWYGHPTEGPSNKLQQRARVTQVLQAINADVYLFQEISSPVAIDTILTRLNAAVGASTYAGICSDETSNNDVSGQRVCFVYKTAVIANPSFRPLLRTIKQNPNLLDGTATTASGDSIPRYPDQLTRFWASGRLPYLMTADVTVNGQTRQMGFLNIHGRSEGGAVGTDRYDMRRYDARALRDTLVAQYPDLPLLIAGDYNDDLDRSITAVSGTFLPTSYEPFTTDPANFSPVTLRLSTNNCRSTRFPDIIDHQMVSNEITVPVPGGRTAATTLTYLTGSSGVEDVTSIFTVTDRTTSDHYPVSSRILFSGPTPVTYRDFRGTYDGTAVHLTWTTATERDNDRFEVQRSADARSFETIGTRVGQGDAARRTTYGFTDATPLAGENYYRLRQIDRDGTAQLSRTIAVRTDAAAWSLRVYPNPTTARLTWTLPETSVGRRVRVYTTTGVLIGQQLGAVPSLDVTTLKPGTYVLEVSTEAGRTLRTRFVKQ
jgi:endonuclease/exonuclease/phosphatase family metal-dependent hydrolase/uncharacterized protein YdeI (BOF family)